MPCNRADVGQRCSPRGSITPLTDYRSVINASFPQVDQVFYPVDRRSDSPKKQLATIEIPNSIESHPRIEYLILRLLIRGSYFISSKRQVDLIIER